MSLHEETARLLALADAATPGPWEIEHDRNEQSNLYAQGRDYWLALFPHQCVGAIQKEQERNARFIAAAHDMVAHIRALDARVRELEQMVGMAGREVNRLTSLIMKAHAAAAEDERIDVIGQNGNDGLHYTEAEAGPTPLRGRVTRRTE